MRKRVRQQCQQLIENMLQAHGMLESFLAAGDDTTAKQLLEACQQTAIALGNVIDASEGEGTEAVSELEGYCELLYGMHEGAEEQAATLNSLIRRVQQQLETLPETREVVFLPYKSSMWDSLESEWRKAEEDPNTHAVVIPIPYFEKNPDGTASNFIYEGDQYPTEVPVVRYDAYDLEQMHPDAIYIHNPYDGRNVVTSVPPEYYSDRLMHYTDDLIYIPYYILDEPDLQSEAEMEHLSHYVLVPAVFHAHHILLQSETMRKAYIQILTGKISEDVRSHYEAAIQVLESPKVYRLKHPKAEDLEIPAEWKDIVLKPDGSRKKVIFYNTSVGTMTDYEEAYLEKIRRVLDIFYEYREDVVLLWRPHPLMEATIEAMEPELKEAYEQLVADYRTGGWGIYDESPEMYRAIQLSDAYYGDPSSVLELYKLTEKPMMIENVNV